MPIEQLILLKIPSPLLGLLMISFAVAISIGGILLVRRFFDVKKLRGHNDIAGPVFSTLGVVYAVILAFVMVISWQNYDRASNDVVREANLYADIYRDFSGFPDPQRTQARETMDTYIRTVIEEEWPLLASGGHSRRAQEILAELWTMYAAFEPRTEVEIAFYREALAKMNLAGELRRMRLLEARTGIHPVLWFMLLAGGLLTITSTFFFGSEHLPAQLIITNLLSVLIALMLLTTLVLDYPFSGGVSIGPDAFQQVLTFIKG